MDDALWLQAALPDWYFGSILSVIARPELLLTIFGVPAIGTLCLAGGIVWGIFRQHRMLWLVLVPVALSHLLVGIAGWFRGDWKSGSEWLLLPFLAVVCIVTIIMVWRSPGSRGPALLLAAFAITYALMAAFISGMAFVDTWM